MSREFKSTLEKEIGLDEISSSTPKAQNFNKTTATPTTSPVSVNQETKIAADPSESYKLHKNLGFRVQIAPEQF